MHVPPHSPGPCEPALALRQRSGPGRLTPYIHTYIPTYIAYLYTYHCGSHHVRESSRMILGRRPPPWESLNRRRISHSHSLYSHSHLLGRWTNCLIRTPSVESNLCVASRAFVPSPKVRSPPRRYPTLHVQVKSLRTDPGSGSTRTRIQRTCDSFVPSGCRGLHALAKHWGHQDRQVHRHS